MPAPAPGWDLISVLAQAPPAVPALAPHLGPGHRSSPCPSPSPSCSSAPHRKHLEDLNAEDSEALAPAVGGQQEGEVAQVLGEEDDQEDGAGGRGTRERRLVGWAGGRGQG